jgi:hypothetical protein
MNIDTGARTKLGMFPERTGNQSGVLGTAGGLLMTAWENGDVSVYDKDGGKLLWNFNTGTNMAAGILAGPEPLSARESGATGIVSTTGCGSAWWQPEPLGVRLAVSLVHEKMLRGPLGPPFCYQ